jgi:hypothetical protein
MITKEELKKVEGNYFEVLQAGAFAITLKSKNTGHYWHLLEREYPTFRNFVIYHKHNVSDEYHVQGTACDLATAVSGIRSHDEFQMNGRKKVRKGKEKI